MLDHCEDGSTHYGRQSTNRRQWIPPSAMPLQVTTQATWTGRDPTDPGDDTEEEPPEPSTLSPFALHTHALPSVVLVGAPKMTEQGVPFWKPSR